MLEIAYPCEKVIWKWKRNI